MEEEASTTPPLPSPSPPPPTSPDSSVAWSTYISEELPRSVQQSTDSAIRSARSIQHSSSTYLHALKDFIPRIGPQYRSYEEAFFHRIKDELVTVKEHPGLAGGVALATGLLLMRGPRRFLFRQTFGRLQSEEAQFNKAEKNVKDMILSVDLLKKESTKLLERSALAEKDMMRGYSNIKNAGTQIQSIAKLVHKAEAEASDLMDMLRQIPSREALKLRAEVASMASNLRQQGKSLEKRVMKISDLGVPV